MSTAPDQAPKIKMTPTEWAVAVVGPVLFIILAVLFVRSFLQPPTAPLPVKALRAGAVKPGMTENEVIARVGEPKGIIEREDGTYYFRYQQSTWDGERKIFTEEDAYVDFSNGFVSGISFEARVPPPPGNQEASP